MNIPTVFGVCMAVWAVLQISREVLFMMHEREELRARVKQAEIDLLSSATDKETSEIHAEMHKRNNEA